METPVQTAEVTATPEKTHEDPLVVAVTAAYDAAEKEATKTPEGAKPAVKPEGTKPAVKPVAVEVARDLATGKFVKPEGAKPAARPEEKPATEKPAARPEEKPAEKPEVKPEGEPEKGEEEPKRQFDRAPQSWKPEARALWSKLPPEFAPVKAEVLRLEREREGVLRESVAARRVADTFAEVVRPYEGFIRAAGRTPMQSVAELMKTAAALRTLPDWDRAVLVAGIARAHSVPPEYLFAALSSEGPLPGTAGTAPAAPQEFRDPRLDQLMDEWTASADRRADAELDQFVAKHPLADEPDVQARMARAIDLAKEDGVDLSYEEAYSGVVAVDPELRAIVEQQQRAESAATSPEGPTARAEAAASSVRSSPVTAAPQTLRGKSVEDHARAAYERAAGRA